MADSSYIKVGITGGIGSGKSVVSKVLRIMGYRVYDCDSAAKELMTGNQQLRAELTAAVGENVYNADGSLNRTVMVSFLFASKDNVARINAIVHPYVRRDFLEWAPCNAVNGMVFMECAILYESGFDALVDKVMAVTAPLEIRIARVMERDNTTRKAVEDRLRHQMGNEELCRKASMVVDNDDCGFITDKVNKCIKDILQ